MIWIFGVVVGLVALIVGFILGQDYKEFEDRAKRHKLHQEHGERLRVFKDNIDARVASVLSELVELRRECV